MTTQEIQEEIINEFKIFDNLMDKYIHLVKLGKSLPLMDLEFKNEKNLVKGCQLTTWFRSSFEDGKVFYNVDSSSVIIKGAISLLKRVLSGQRPKDVISADLYFIDRAGLQEIFSPIRANSLWKIENQMREYATVCETKT
ncbi:MAG: SufE family protein [Candidatus Magasanikbacteria bacterium]